MLWGSGEIPVAFWKLASERADGEGCKPVVCRRNAKERARRCAISVWQHQQAAFLPGEPVGLGPGSMSGFEAQVLKSLARDHVDRQRRTGRLLGESNGHAGILDMVGAGGVSTSQIVEMLK